jgi:ketopantoate reductase
MMHDLLGNRPLEVDAVFGDIVERAEKHGLPVSSLRFAREVIRGLDQARKEGV